MDGRNTYAKFVSDIYSAVLEIMPTSGKNLLTFAAGEISRNEINDSAFLRNDKALFFYRVLLSNNEMFHIDPSKVILHRSLIFRDEVSIQHSCYAKNLRRWMNGQTPRKRRCRAEFVVLSYSWANAFGTSKKNNDKYALCRKKIRMLCQSYINQANTDSYPLLVLIWQASCSAYIAQYSL